jgi:hypothetical protein
VSDTLADRKALRLSWWEHWWFREVPPHALACFRIVVGAFLFLYWSLYLPHVPLLFGRAGLAMPVADVEDGWPAWLVSLIETPSTPMAYGALSLLLVSFMAIAAGACFRTACVSALVLLTYVWASSQHWSWFTLEQVSIIFLIILAGSGAHQTLSLHIWRRTGSWRSWHPVSVLPQRLLSVQVTATFLGAGWLKMTMPDWQDGQVVAAALVGPWATPLAFWVAQRELPMWVYDVFTEGLRAFEMALPFGLWSPWWKWFLAGATVFLVTNALLLSFWWFLVLLPSYIVFCGPENVANYLNAPGPLENREPIER